MVISLFAIRDLLSRKYLLSPCPWPNLPYTSPTECLWLKVCSDLDPSFWVKEEGQSRIEQKILFGSHCLFPWFNLPHTSPTEFLCSKEMCAVTLKDVSQSRIKVISDHAKNLSFKSFYTAYILQPYLIWLIPHINKAFW